MTQQSRRSMLARALGYAGFRLRQARVRRERPRLIAQAFARAEALAASRGPAGKAALFLPTADPGNLGDEAVLIATAAELRSRGFERVCIIAFGPDKLYDIPGAENAVIQLHHDPVGEDYLAFVELAKDFSHLFIWGADIVDGTHGQGVVTPRQVLANLADTLGLKAAICSFSVSTTRSKAAMDLFLGLRPGVRLFCRDRMSAERLQSELPPGRVELSADLAFLLPPDHEAPFSVQAAAWAKARRAEGKVILGLNVNDLFCSYFDIPEDALLDYYAQALSRLAERAPPFAIAHLPHDTHANKSLGMITDFTLARRLNAMLPPALAETSFIADETVSAPEIRAMASYMDLIFSARMHLSIASLAVGSPVFGVAYQGKFEGLFDHFGLTDMYLTVDQLKDAEATTAFLEGAFERREAVRAQVAERLPAVRALALANLDI